MIIVVSSPGIVANESDIINELFEEGLELFHFRKPGITNDQLLKAIEKIDSHYLDRIAWHHHPNGFPVKRMHFSEEHRGNQGREDLLSLKKEGKVLSTSIHSLDNEEGLFPLFDYAFFGPVFNSISKNNYKSVITKEFNVSGRKTNLIAIGGIDANNVIDAYKMGFHGIAVLGAVWQKGNPVENFKHIRKACSSLVL